MSLSSGSLEVEGLSKEFGSKAVLDRVSFSLEPGSITCVTGENGAGKSTLVRCLVGLARFTGAARLDGIELPDGPGVRRWIGYVPQNPALLDTATVEETLRFFARLRGVPEVQAAPWSGFLPPGDARVGTLSGGQRQRVALAVGLLGRPRLLLLDEPTANLDASGRAVAWRFVRDAAAEGTTVLVVSPAASDLDGIVDRVLVLEGGRIVQDDAVVSPTLPSPRVVPSPSVIGAISEVEVGNG